MRVDMRVLITGMAGFIGFHMAKALQSLGIEVVGIDNFNSYYDPALKKQRAALLQEMGIKTHVLDINDPTFPTFVHLHKPTHLLHLAAQAGVRYSLTHPQAYVKTNLEGFTQVLETIRQDTSIKLVYASSSSVYGLNSKLPYSVSDPTDSQASFYGVTKKANELMAANYTHLFGIQATGLRFFTVYGPWGRPDMALFSFTRAILEEKPIELFNHGNMRRDFTYIDDIVRGTLSALQYQGDTPIFNLGNNSPHTLSEFVKILENALGKKANCILKPMQPGEVLTTYADIKESTQELGFIPKVSLEQGISRFVDWYLSWKDCERRDLNPHGITPTTTSK